jgi:glycosyltransferase involved in cell wall biosynthesis
MEKALHVVGWIHYGQVPALLRHADVGLAILQQEPYYVVATPVKLFEYMASGLPIVASNFPAMAAVINEAQCGALVKPTDVEAAAGHIRYWWEHPDEARSAGENGRQSVLQKYNWETLMQRLDALYAQIINSALRE